MPKGTDRRIDHNAVEESLDTLKRAVENGHELDPAVAGVIIAAARRVEAAMKLDRNVREEKIREILDNQTGSLGWYLDRLSGGEDDLKDKIDWWAKREGYVVNEDLGEEVRFGDFCDPKAFNIELEIDGAKYGVVNGAFLSIFKFYPAQDFMKAHWAKVFKVYENRSLSKIDGL